MKKIFTYESFEKKLVNNELTLVFNFKIDSNISFSPKIIVKNLPKNFSELDMEVVDNFIFHMGLAEIPSYWKSTIAPVIEIKAGYLNDAQIKWWNNLFMKGMGQFFYENKINFTKDNFLEIKVVGKEKIINQAEINGNKILVPVGGGKDSSVTLSLLKKQYEVSAFAINPINASLNS